MRACGRSAAYAVFCGGTGSIEKISAPLRRPIAGGPISFEKSDRGPKKFASLFFLAFLWLRTFRRGRCPLHPYKPFEKGLCENFMFALFERYAR